jgi:hypothetical protein
LASKAKEPVKVSVEVKKREEKVHDDDLTFNEEIESKYSDSEIPVEEPNTERLPSQVAVDVEEEKRSELVFEETEEADSGSRPETGATKENHSSPQVMR